jgi:hypothetical protein
VRIASRLARVLLVGLVPLVLVPSIPTNATASHTVAARAKHNVADTSCGIKPVRYAGLTGKGSCPGVRPGGNVYWYEKQGKRTYVGNCTLNFIFTGRDGYTYAGTAGHCISTSQYEKKWPGYTGRKAYYNPYGPPYNNQRYLSLMGTFAYGILRDGTGGVLPVRDFALIRLKPGLKANPKMCYFGGPDGIYTKHDPGPALLKHFGNGIYWGKNRPARTHLAPTMIHPDMVQAFGMAGPGDSGAGVINGAGEAVGVLVAGIDLRMVFAISGYPTSVPWVSASIFITRLDVQLARAQKVLRTRLSMRSAKVSPFTPTSL